MNSIDYRQDVKALQDLVSRVSYEEFMSMFYFQNVRVEDGHELLDFDYEHLTATINKSGQECYITGCYDCYDDEGQWVDTIYDKRIPLSTSQKMTNR